MSKEFDLNQPVSSMIEDAEVLLGSFQVELGNNRNSRPRKLLEQELSSLRSYPPETTLQQVLNDRTTSDK